MKRNEKDWPLLKIIAVAVCCIGMGVGIVAYLVSLISTSNTRYEKEQAFELETNTTYHLSHPVIIGTNENGEVIKRYFVPGYGHFIYEIGETKTSNRDLGKFGMQVTVEKH